MTSFEEPTARNYQSDIPYQPLGLDPWTPVFDDEGKLDYNRVMPPVGPWKALADRSGRSSYQLAMEVAENAVSEVKDCELRSAATVGLMSTLANQAGRNDVNNTPLVRRRLYDEHVDGVHGFTTYADILYGKASPDMLARTVVDHDDLIVSLEIARETHFNEWEQGHEINRDVRAQLLGAAALNAQPENGLPRYKLKSFMDRYALAERKRTVMSLMGGKVLVVMRLNFLLDMGVDDGNGNYSGDMPDVVRQHIIREFTKQTDRESKSYDFDAENVLLRDTLDDAYIRKPLEDGKPGFVIPAQTGYYAFSPEAHVKEKEAQKAEQLRLKNAAPEVKRRWAAEWTD